MLTQEQTAVKASIVKLVVEIETPRGSNRYTVGEIDPGCAGAKAYELNKHAAGKAQAECYHVVATHSGLIECTCADYLYRRQGTAELCKHGSSLVSLGLLAAPSVAPTPAPAPCCPASEPEPCVACLAAPAEPPAVYGDEAPVATDAEMFIPEDADPADVESDPELWPADPRWDSWFATPIEPEPTPEPEPAIVPGVDSYQTFRPDPSDERWERSGWRDRPADRRRAGMPSRPTRVKFDKPL